MKKIVLIQALFFFFMFPVSSEVVRIASANLYAANTQYKLVSRQLIALDADIIILLEWTGNKEIDRDFKDYQFVVNESTKGAHGIAILSKKTLPGQARLIENPVKGPCAMPLASFSFHVGQQKITVMGVHLPPPLKSCQNTTQKTLKAIQNWIKDGKLIQAVGSGQKGDLLVLAGDFNSFSSHQTIKKFKKIGLIDSIKKAKGLYQATWSPSAYLPKLIRIDYIFVSHYLQLLNSKTFHIPGSDHRGVVVEIELP